MLQNMLWAHNQISRTLQTSLLTAAAHSWKTSEILQRPHTSIDCQYLQSYCTTVGEVATMCAYMNSMKDEMKLLAASCRHRQVLIIRLSTYYTVPYVWNVFKLAVLYFFPFKEQYVWYIDAMRQYSLGYWYYETSMYEAEIYSDARQQSSTCSMWSETDDDCHGLHLPHIVILLGWRCRGNVLSEGEKGLILWWIRHESWKLSKWVCATCAYVLPNHVSPTVCVFVQLMLWRTS